jgi:hypothetical protein
MFIYIPRTEDSKIFATSERHTKDPIGTNPYENVQMFGPFLTAQAAGLHAVQSGCCGYTIIELSGNILLQLLTDKLSEAAKDVTDAEINLCEKDNASPQVTTFMLRRISFNEGRQSVLRELVALCSEETP